MTSPNPQEGGKHTPGPWQIEGRRGDHQPGAGRMTQAPATPELVERLKGLLVEEDRMHPVGCATWIEEACVTVEEAADALEAQQARIAELEVENERLRLTMLGGEDVAGFASSLPLAQVLDSFRTYETALRDSANSAQALADRYEKALDLALDVAIGQERRLIKYGKPANELAWLIEQIRQALSSSQGRHEGVTSGFIPELPGVNAVPLPASPYGPLSDPRFVHLNMLRGGIAKLSPAQIGHLYRGAEAAEVIAEVMRQNPAVQPTDAFYGLVTAARRHIATHPVFRTRRIGGEGSRSRLEQEDQIVSEDALRAAIQAALSASPDNTNPKAGAPEHG